MASDTKTRTPAPGRKLGLAGKPTTSRAELRARAKDPSALERPSFVCTPALLSEIDRAAAKQGMVRSEWIRMVLEAAVKPDETAVALRVVDAARTLLEEMRRK